LLPQDVKSKWNLGRVMSQFEIAVLAGRCGMWQDTVMPKRQRDIALIGAYTTAGGIVAAILGFVLGAGPCNATTPGLILEISGILAFAVGFVTLIVGLFLAEKRTARNSN